MRGNALSGKFVVVVAVVVGGDSDFNGVDRRAREGAKGHLDLGSVCPPRGGRGGGGGGGVASASDRGSYGLWSLLDNELTMRQNRRFPTSE